MEKFTPESGDQLSAQNSLKTYIKFLDSLLEINFYSLTIIFFLRFFHDITIFFIFPLDKMVNSLIVKAKPWQLVSRLQNTWITVKQRLVLL